MGETPEQRRERESFDRYKAAINDSQRELITRWGVPVEDAVRIVYDLAQAARDRGWDSAVLPIAIVNKENGS